MSTCAGLEPDFPTWHRTREDELVNTATHGFGLVLAVVGALVMMGGVLTIGNPRLTLGCGVYLATLVAVYAMSTLSHGVTTYRWKSLFRKLDQAFIYLLIVGTYTPFSVCCLHGVFWNVMLTAMWIIALAGFSAKAVFAHRIETGSIRTYVLLGWMPIVAIPALSYLLPASAVALILGGGVCYMIGTIFLTYETHVRHFHAAWHLSVIAGSTCHYLAVYAIVQSGR
jgi:hemolysin III